MPALSADNNGCDVTVEELLQAYYDCRKNKRNTNNAIAFELNLEQNIMNLYNDLMDGSYKPTRSICFVVTRPKPREVWAANFRDRVVHHLLYNRISKRFHNSFIYDSSACIPERGTLFGAKRLESKVRSITQNWSKEAYYMKCDFSNFFVSIDKRILLSILAKKIHEPWLMSLAEIIVMHDPMNDVEIRSAQELLDLIPTHKSLFNSPITHGLPIGNLSSQFFANVYLNELDQFIKHVLQAKHYVRYVDDFVLLSKDKDQLLEWLGKIEEFSLGKLGLTLNPKKTIIQPIDRGIDFVGHVVKPWRTTARKRTVKSAVSRLKEASDGDSLPSVNSYLGLLRHGKNHFFRARIANIARLKGHSVDHLFTKAYRRKLCC